MRRFLVEELKEDSRRVCIRGGEFRHLSRVLRLVPGTRVVVFNGSGLEFTARIESVTKTSATAVIEERIEAAKESPLELTLIQGLVKGGKPELIIQKATELGVKKIFFYNASRTVPQIHEERLEEKLKRWRRVAVEASKQCGRSIVPPVHGITDLEETLSSIEAQLKLMLYEGEGVRPLKEVLRQAGGIDSVSVCTGPEGGLSHEEVLVGSRLGFRAVGLGPRILRAETASIAALSIVQYELGDLG